MVIPPLGSPPVSDVDAIDLGPLAALVARAFPAPGRGRCDLDRGFDCTQMPGGASTRKYYRVRTGRETAVGMFVPDGLKAEEVAKGAPHGSVRWPFLEVLDLLASRGISVPHVYGEDTARGWVLLEDLGDHTLATFLELHPDRRQELYTRAVTDIARAQDSLAELPEGCIVRSRAFDEDLLLWEIQHFREWALDARGISSRQTTGRVSTPSRSGSRRASQVGPEASFTATTSRAI